MSPDPTTTARDVTLGHVTRLWAPLAGSWLLMGIEMPLVAAVVARLPDTEVQLAAFGSIVYPFSLLVEAPIIMLLAASTALAADTQSHRWLLRFTHLAGIALTALHALVAFTPLFDILATDVIGVPHPVVEPARLGLRIMLPWTWSIAYRRLQQGVLIRLDHSRLVVIGTGIRLSSNAVTLVVGLLIGGLPGIAVGTAGIATGVIAEALFAGWCVRRFATDRLASATPAPRPLALGPFLRFYLPLACTPLIAIAAQPIGSMAMSSMPEAIGSLAAWSPVHALVFLLRSAGFAFHEVVVALYGRPGGPRALDRFARLLIASTVGLLVLLVLTPLGRVWYESVLGLSAELTQVCLIGVALAVLMPGYQVLQSLWQGQLVLARRTAPVTGAVILYLVVVSALLRAAVVWGQMRGLEAAVISFTLAGLSQTVWLWAFARKTGRGA